MPHVFPRRDPVTIRAAGGPTVIIDVGGLRLVTDPTFDPPGTYLSGSGSMLTKTAPPALTPGQIGSVDAVLLSHDQHVDNLDASGWQFLRTTPLVLTTASAAGLLGAPSRALAPFAHIDILGPPGTRCGSRRCRPSTGPTEPSS